MVQETIKFMRQKKTIKIPSSHYPTLGKYTKVPLHPDGWLKKSGTLTLAFRNNGLVYSGLFRLSTFDLGGMILSIREADC